MGVDHLPESAGTAVEVAPGVTLPAAALRFSFSRSGGPGGQNVNKVETRAELRVAVADLPISQRAAGRVRTMAGRRLVEGDDLRFVSAVHRSQSRNKSECLQRLRELLLRALPEPRIRRPTRPTRSSRERRLAQKRVRSDVKRRRGSGSED